MKHVPNSIEKYMLYDTFLLHTNKYCLKSLSTKRTQVSSLDIERLCALFSDSDKALTNRNSPSSSAFDLPALK